MKKFPLIICLTSIIVLLYLATSCIFKNNRTITTYNLPDTLKVGTLYSPMSFFIYKGDTLGYDYERINNFCKEKGITIDYIIAYNLPHMIELLDSGIIDIIAYEVPIINEYKDNLVACGTENITNQVLVQRKSKDMITDAIQLIGKDVYVEKNSKYELRLQNLDNEIGGGITIHCLDDSIITEDLIEMVAKNKIPFTVVDSDIARLNRTYYRNIDISVPISFAQRGAWAVSVDNSFLADSINTWTQSATSIDASKSLLKRYFELSKSEEAPYEISLKIINGVISPYDNIFKKHGAEINWDWRLFASQAWCESRFDTTAVSWAGAKGLMQLMPSSARALGVDPDLMSNPELNVQTAAAIIKKLNIIFEKKVSDTNERRKFVLASYNAGIGHVYDAMALAEKYGKNPQVWEGNVSETIRWKSNPEYFNDEVCKFGYFRGKETNAYVEKVEHYYKYFCDNVK